MFISGSIEKCFSQDVIQIVVKKPKDSIPKVEKIYSITGNWTYSTRIGYNIDSSMLKDTSYPFYDLYCTFQSNGKYKFKDVDNTTYESGRWKILNNNSLILSHRHWRKKDDYTPSLKDVQEINFVSKNTFFVIHRTKGPSTRIIFHKIKTLNKR